MDPYEEVAQQGQVHPLSPAYVSNPMELDEHVPVHVLELEHLEYDASSDDDIQVEDDDEDPKEDPNKEREPEDEDTKEPSEGSDETKPLEEDETAVTPPPPSQRRARISVRPQTPMAASTKALIDAFVVGSSPFPLPPTSPAYDQVPSGHRAAMIRKRDNIPEEDMPPWRRFAFTAPLPGYDVAESSAAATRAPRSQAEDVGYVRALQASERRMMTSIEEVNLRTDGRDIRLEIDVVRGQRTAYETELQERQSAEDLVVTQMMRIHTLEARAHTDMVEDVDSSWTEGIVGLSQRLEKMESVFHISGCSINNQVKFATCTLLGAALTWWNGHVRTLGHEAAYALTWGTLKKKMTDKYCQKGEIKKLEIELWNLRVKGNDVAAYTQRFQELALMCTKFLANETEKVDKYISGLPDNIHGNVISARPKTLDETIEVVVPTGTYVVPTGRVVVPTGRYIVPTGRVVVLTGRVISLDRIPTGRYVVPTGTVVVPTGRVISPGRIPTGRATLYILYAIIY
nr:reverse transcriptase domain-containing protein [Tanacetum cinerariifolium]